MYLGTDSEDGVGIPEAVTSELKISRIDEGLKGRCSVCSVPSDSGKKAGVFGELKGTQGGQVLESMWLRLGRPAGPDQAMGAQRRVLVFIRKALEAAEGF